jgi:hypothetical protein
MDTIFDYYDKQGDSRIDYRQFIDQVLFKPQTEEDLRQSTKQLIEEKLSHSKLMGVDADIHSSPISKTKAPQSVSKSQSKSLNTQEDIVNFIRDRLRD